MNDAQGGPGATRGDRSIPLDRAQRILSSIWFAFAGLIVLILIVQTMKGAYSFDGTSRVTEAWNWAMPQFVPTLSLMIGVFAASALVQTTAESRVGRSFFHLAVALSITYLTAVFGTILLEPAARGVGGANPIELMNVSNLWLSPFQGLVASALGALFVIKQS